MVDLPRDLYYDLDGFPFGEGTNYLVQDFQVSPDEIITNDAQMPRQDGVRFGRDFRGSQTLTFEIVLMSGTGVDAQDEFDALRSAWLGDDVRARPGAVQVLRITRGGRTRRVYGRSRRFAPAPERDRFGWFSVTADFQCSDHLFYSDAELVTTVGMASPSVGGLIGSLVGPIDAESAGEGIQDVFVGGSKPAWPVIRINGPIVDPSIELVGGWSFTMRTTLASDQWLIVDPTPWNRAVRRSDGANLAGTFTATSQRISQLRVPTGYQQFLLRGLDPTGTASANIYIREASASY